MLLVLACAVPAQAEPMFVADRLVLNVYAQADQSSDRIATLQTGDAVEAFERVENLIHVRLSDGREGWVGANYLTTEMPAVLQLRQLQRDQTSSAQTTQKQLTDEIARLQKQNATLQDQLDESKRKAAAPMPTTAAVENTAAEQSAQRDTEVPVQIRHADMQPVTGIPWMWPALVLATGIAGFTFGYHTLARRIRKKFGGLKIY